jgi:glutamate/tyrosine decarboxylase-like PLP-dependent enzyme
MIVHPTIRVLVKPLGVHELLQCKLRNTVHTADQLSARILGFGFPTAVVDHTVYLNRVEDHIAVKAALDSILADNVVLTYGTQTF